MNLELLRLLFDFGLVVLIWLVQLTIYPAFLFYQKENLLKWHQKYTVGISIVVIPLMFGQLITATIQIIKVQNSYTLVSGILILLVWAITFSQFVPMHSKIAKGNSSTKLLKELVFLNWSRTILWSFIFLVRLLHFINN